MNDFNTCQVQFNCDFIKLQVKVVGRFLLSICLSRKSYSPRDMGFYAALYSEDRLTAYFAIFVS
jgi:hypothetical protein